MHSSTLVSWWRFEDCNQMWWAIITITSSCGWGKRPNLLGRDCLGKLKINLANTTYCFLLAVHIFHGLLSNCKTFKVNFRDHIFKKHFKPCGKVIYNMPLPGVRYQKTWILELLRNWTRKSTFLLTLAQWASDLQPYLKVSQHLNKWKIQCWAWYHQCYLSFAVEFLEGALSADGRKCTCLKYNVDEGWQRLVIYWSWATN